MWVTDHKMMKNVELFFPVLVTIRIKVSLKVVFNRIQTEVWNLWGRIMVKQAIDNFSL